MQLLSILLVAAGLMEEGEDFDAMLKEDFSIDDKMSIVYKRIRRYVSLAVPAVLGFAVSVFYSLWGENVYGDAIPFATQLSSVLNWFVVSAGLLMLAETP